ncbi:hypothetical protein QMZ92_13275 [Streptomyces sp. HNM0645]|uniref:hypothetical protein n=1 Tax=Streptomyces sp. HNM0645 TaxID=2782343 RepID=UPI0024B68FF4|nr:hypothetical protein [Streptomyces sp. HNM0645]MDI9885339.1 hypothetical protein [Streptomyces sp. HNM0645]
MPETAPTLQPWAAGRDASWYSRPNVRSRKVVHMAGDPIREGTASRCGRSVLDDSLTWIPEQVPEHLRCHRSGCRQAWAAHPPNFAP